MPNIQEIWNRIEEIKQEQKEIRAAYRDILNSVEYESLTEELDSLKTRKKQFERNAAISMEEKMNRLDFLKRQFAEENQLLSDLALSTLLKGERVEVTGVNDIAYDPLFSVKFRKRS
jgi:predicted  nucleic acid-binding Zn-ribbon protein